MIRRFTSAQFVPANAGAKAKNPVGSTLFSTPMVALLRHSGHKILRTCCRESARKRLKTRRTITVGGKEYDYFSLSAAADAAGLGDIERLPFSLKVLLENLIRLEDGRAVTVNDIKAVGAWLKSGTSEHEIAFRPARVLMQDFTGVPAIVDLAA